MNEKALVVGAGIVGLGSALKLLQSGFEVVLYNHTATCPPTTPISAAFWFPYACSMSVEQEKSLAGPTYEFLCECAADRTQGINLRTGRAYFDTTVEEYDTRSPWWATLVRGFRHLSRNDIPIALQTDHLIGPICCGWEFEIPVVHIPTFTQWLEGKIISLGGRIVDSHIKSFQGIAESCDVLVNCSGGWATHLTPDSSLVGYQGTVLELPNEPFGDMLLFVEKGKSSRLPTYIVPQGSRTILGGTLVPTTKPGEAWMHGPEGLATQWQGTEKEIIGIYQRCRLLAGITEELTHAEILEIKHKTGLRPVRQQSPPRIEAVKQDGRTIIHNYGHGGSGLTLFWGSAIEVGRLLEA